MKLGLGYLICALIIIILVIVKYVFFYSLYIFAIYLILNTKSTWTSFQADDDLHDLNMLWTSLSLLFLHIFIIIYQYFLFKYCLVLIFEYQKKCCVNTWIPEEEKNSPKMIQRNALKYVYTYLATILFFSLRHMKKFKVNRFSLLCNNFNLI